MGLGVGSLCLLGLVAAVVFPRLLEVDAVDSDTVESGKTDSISAESDMIRIAEYPPGPRLPSTTELLPRDFVDSLPTGIDQYVEAIPPEQNQAPKLLEVLKVLTDDLAVCFPESEREQIARVGATNKANILAWHDEYQRSGRLPTVDQVRQFDDLFTRLKQVSQEPCRFYLVTNSIAAYPETSTLAVLIRLLHMRTCVLRGQIPLDQHIDELAAVSRVCHTFASMGPTTYIATAMICFRSLYTDTMPSLPLENQSPESTIRKLIAVLKNDLRPVTRSQLRQTALSDELLFWNLTEHIQDSPSEFDAYIDAVGINQEVGQLLSAQLRLMTPDQIALNRDAYHQEVDRFVDFVRGDRLGQRFQSFDEGYRTRKNSLNRQAEADSGRINEYPWLTAVILPHNPIHIRWMLELEALQHVAIAELAIRLQATKLGTNATNLSQALADVDAERFATDPFSEEPLKMIERDGGTIVYSVGPNLEDDRATPVILFADDILTGDIFYSFARD